MKRTRKMTRSLKLTLRAKKYPRNPKYGALMPSSCTVTGYT